MKEFHGLVTLETVIKWLPCLGHTMWKAKVNHLSPPRLFFLNKLGTHFFRISTGWIRDRRWDGGGVNFSVPPKQSSDHLPFTPLLSTLTIRLPSLLNAHSVTIGWPWYLQMTSVYILHCHIDHEKSFVNHTYFTVINFFTYVFETGNKAITHYTCGISDESLMERLMRTLEPYKRFSKPKDGQYYDVRVLTKLVKNYRSHPEILIVPNKLFYDGELEPFADKSSREQLCGWDGLPNKNAPVVFHAVIGEDMQEAGSPSFFNPQEVSVVISYIKKLVGMKISPQQKIEAKDIGIISPYKKQVIYTFLLLV